MPFLFQRTRSRPGADDQALALVRAELPRVERLLGRILGPRPDLDDLVQTVFVEACRAFAHYRGEGSAGAFVGGIAVRVARRALRGSAFSRARAELREEPPSAAQGPDEVYAARQRIVRLRVALARLSAKKRIAFCLWALEGLEPQEIATLTQASLAATRSRIFHAQRELRQLALRDPVLREVLEGGEA